MASKLPRFFGLDLGHDTFKMAEIKRTGSKGSLEALGSVAVQQFGSLDNLAGKDLDSLAEKIKQAHKVSKISTHNCVISVPEVSVFSRLLKLPKMKEDEEEESIQWALKPLIPVALEQVNISYLQIDTVKENGQEMVNWYVVAAPHKLIETIRTIGQKSDMRLLAIETEALATARSVYYNSKIKGDSIIVDLGAESTNVVLARSGVVVFSQTTNTGSDAVTQVIASDYGIDMQQAEQYKATYGIDFEAGDGKIARTIEPILNIIISEISRTLTYFKERISDKEVKQIFLTGGGATLPKLEEYVTNKLGIKAIVSNPLSNLQVSKAAKKQVEQININGYGVAIGLGLKTR